MNTVDRLRIVMCFNRLTAAQANKNGNLNNFLAKILLN